MKYRLLLISISIGMVIIGSLAYQDGYWRIQSKNSTQTNARPVAVLSPSQKLEQLGLLTERLQGAVDYRPTKEETEEDNQYFREQVAAIELALPGHDIEQRLEDTEQLAAYPIPEAVELLSVILEKDPDPGVREMAAQTLGGLEPGARSIDSLLLAFEDPSEPVKSAALLSLELLLNKSHRSVERDRIIRGLMLT
ncbi:MAG: HEAT repeat domain-containing protein, partial [Methylococcales bacterium]